MATKREPLFVRTASQYPDNTMELPDSLVSQIRQGNAVIFFGAGASRGTYSPNGKKCPATADLINRLSDQFLGGKYKSAPLNQVAELAISETDLLRVQSFIADLLSNLQPSLAHLKLPNFDWYGLGTTNYDLLVESAYASSTVTSQTLHPFIESTDRVDDSLKDSLSVLYIKLHGCITRINNPSCPLILTTDQYVEHRTGRGRLFDIFTDWGYEHPIIFVGQSLQDPDLRAVIGHLTQEIGDNRPRYFLVAPDADETLGRFWESKKITVLKTDFDGFMNALDAAIPTAFRHLSLAAGQEREHEIERKFRVKTQLSKACIQFLTEDVEYINGISSTTIVKPYDFYRGYESGFGAIEQKLDVRRTLADNILTDHVLEDPETPQVEPEVILIRAHAGAGKSILLKRIAWDAGKDFDRVALFLKPQGILNAAPIRELIGACKERIYIFVDNAADRVREIQALIRNVGPEGQLLSLILCERTNEWNNNGQQLAAYVTDEYELRYLSTKEIDLLLELLSTHRALGTLTKSTREEQRAAFAERAGRQLLVALYEATFGVPFEDIIVDEFNTIEPFEAQRLYLTICVLNRLEVPVRAGVIARIHGIRFNEFKERFFSPLEHIVFTSFDKATRDNVYRARHSHIADIVFHRLLTNPEDRFEMYIKCLKALNTAYGADWKAFWQMVRGRALLELFPDHQMVLELYRVAKDSVGEEDPHLLHQLALYEINRPNGNHDEARRLLARATELAPYDISIKHSSAEFKLRAADNADSQLQKAKSLKEAGAISRELVAADKENAHAHHTLVKVGIRTLQEALKNNESDDAIAKTVKDVEDQLFAASQLFPGDSYLSESEADLAKALNDSDRALKAMVKAFDANPRNGFIALRLAQTYQGQGDSTRATTILKKALEANNSDKRLHFAYAKLLMSTSSAVGDELLYHLKRAYTPGDSNFDAQLLYGRELFIKGEIALSREVFDGLSKARVSPQRKHHLHYPIQHQRFSGKMNAIGTNHAFIVRDGLGDLIFVHVSNVPLGVWKDLGRGDHVLFSIAFTFKGANAFDLQLSSKPGSRQGQLNLLSTVRAIRE